MNDLYLKQNKLDPINYLEDKVETQLFGHIYNVYLDVKCHHCNAPLIAIKNIDNDNIPTHLPLAGCSNIFCEDYILYLI